MKNVALECSNHREIPGSTRKIWQVALFVLFALLAQPSEAVAPIYWWRNTMGHSGDGFADEGSAYNAAVADSFANDLTPDDGCWADPLSGSFPFWGAILHGCSDVSVAASCPPNTQMNGDTRSCGLLTGKNNPDQSAGQPLVCEGNPCDPATGNKYQREQDYRSKAAPLLRLVRHYNGLYPRQTSLGAQWKHDYDRRIAYRSGEIHAYAHRADGKIVEFTLTDGVFVPPVNIPATLLETRDASGTHTGWRYVSEEEEVETYDAAGHLIFLANRAGLAQTLTYDVQNRLSQVSDSFGRTLSLSYDGLNRIRTVTDPAGGVIRYAYDTAGNLSVVTYPDATPADSADNPARLYHYEDPRFPHALTGITDENGARYATWSYDAQGRAASSEHAGGAEQVTLSYEADGSTTVTDALGKTRHYAFETVLGVVRPTRVEESCPGCESRARTYGYDAQGNATFRTDFNGNLSCFAHDPARNLQTARLEGIAPGGACPTDLTAYTPAAGSTERKVTTAWHPTFRLPIRVEEAGQRTESVYTAAGNLLSRTVTDTATGQSRVWTFTYNGYGQVLTEDGSRTDVNDVTTYSYYTDTTATHTTGDLWNVTNPLGHVTAYTQYDQHGKPLAIQDPNGLLTSLAYDPRGRLTGKTVDGHTTSYAYDAAGNLIRLTLPTGVFYQYGYDAAHRLTDITDAFGGNLHYTLDAVGHRIREDIREAGGTVVKTHRRVYDALARLAEDIGAYNQTTRYQYDPNGNLTGITDPLNQITGQTYDA
ncbi:MAG TPA: DUF6531 domain-containing protein, partial [Methylococcaceae bacterium]|nr:DUF6531 domain-containing protein [Methylococcaceae bacterium]